MPASQSTCSTFGVTRLFHGWPAALLLVIAIAAPLWHIHTINGHMPYSKNDLVSRWIGSRALLRGENPYTAEVTREIQVAYYGRPLRSGEDIEPQEFAYPAYVALLMAPLAHLSIGKACLAFVAAVVPFLALSFWLCARTVTHRISRVQTLIAVLFSLFSWAVVWGVRLQQLTLAVAALVFVASFLLTRKRNAAAGFLLALAMIKPQLVLPLVLWLLVWAFIRRSWSFVASFAITFAALLLWAEFKLPGWFHAWLQDIHGYGPHTAMPLETTLGHGFGLAATALLISYCALVLWRLRHASPESSDFALAIALALAATLCVTLTKLALIYNQVLLLPGCLILIHTRSDEFYPALARRIAILAVMWGYVAVCISAIGETLFGPNAAWDALPCRNQILPVLVGLALAIKVPAFAVARLPVEPRIGRELDPWKMPS